MVTVTQSGFHFYVQNCVDSAIVHELFYNSCNSVIVVRTPCAVDRAFYQSKDELSVIYTVKLSELISVCSASSKNIFLRAMVPCT
jgi:hypothetical protein